MVVIGHRVGQQLAVPGLEGQGDSANRLVMGTPALLILSMDKILHDSKCTTASYSVVIDV